MTEQEKAVIEALSAAWNAFCALPCEHADDNDEFRRGIHILQRQVFARPARRQYNLPE
ncbi:hypothetical protein ALO98_200139 [Pseudomonas syringae pv. tagetis]|nr:hypothetical protein ALO98_200139 [Pseudomonas syringae pv. tagetis]